MSLGDPRKTLCDIEIEWAELSGTKERELGTFAGRSSEAWVETGQKFIVTDVLRPGAATGPASAARVRRPLGRSPTPAWARGPGAHAERGPLPAPPTPLGPRRRPRTSGNEHPRTGSRACGEACSPSRPLPGQGLQHPGGRGTHLPSGKRPELRERPREPGPPSAGRRREQRGEAALTCVASGRTPRTQSPGEAAEGRRGRGQEPLCPRGTPFLNPFTLPARLRLPPALCLPVLAPAARCDVHVAPRTLGCGLEA
ncbi:PREDICTED: collagen alpha-1(III) chain-like [Lipotes vexillifer]|uniref:Collagen alpha-1(III) chain-like n=1 Tax=Lipotes vexillifer TaxID=118797 RepID=A0A340XFT2_LIPVE|nr:PREDICTED: collagen alpha-1(III) chain-like [Lipotes vexillifer]